MSRTDLEWIPTFNSCSAPPKVYFWTFLIPLYCIHSEGPLKKQVSCLLSRAAHQATHAWWEATHDARPCNRPLDRGNNIHRSTHDWKNVFQPISIKLGRAVPVNVILKSSKRRWLHLQVFPPSGLLVMTVIRPRPSKFQTTAGAQLLQK